MKKLENIQKKSEKNVRDFLSFLNFSKFMLKNQLRSI